MGTFGIAHGVPIVIAGALTRAATQFPFAHRLTRWIERAGAALMFAAAAYFVYEGLFYAGWLNG